MSTRVKVGSLREMGPDEIRTRVGELREELSNVEEQARGDSRRRKRARK